MAKLPILIAPHPKLRKVAAPVAEMDDSRRRLFDDMLETMYHAPGIGLAAPQVGVLERLIVLDCAGEGETPQPYRMVNPEILWRAETTASFEEGCLSLPDLTAEVMRPTAVSLRYQDADGTPHEMDAEGLLATVIQHEVDHLDGVLFVDHLSHLKRNMMLRKLSKQMQKSGKPAYAEASA